MSEYFITQFTEVLPKILIIGEDGNFSQQVCQLFQQRSFNVDFFDFSNNTLSAQNQKKLQEQTYYKIVCLFNLSGNTPNVESIIKILKTRKEPMLVLTRFDSIIDVDSSSTHTWLEYSREQYNNILALQLALTKSTLILIRDLILEENYYHPAHSYFFYHLASRQLLNPQFDFYFISQKNFLSQIQSYLFAPYSGDKIIVEPNAVPALKYFRSLNYFFDYQYQVVNQSFTAPVYEFPFIIKKIAIQSDLDFLNEQYIKAHLKNHPSLTPPAESQPPNANQTEKNKVINSPPLTPPLSYSAKPNDLKNHQTTSSSFNPNSLFDSKSNSSTNHKSENRVFINKQVNPSVQKLNSKKSTNDKEEKFLAQYSNNHFLIGQVKCQPVCDLNNFNFIKTSHQALNFAKIFPLLKNNAQLATNLKEVAVPAIVDEHFSASPKEKTVSPLVFYQAASHLSHSKIKCFPQCNLQNFNFAKIHSRLESPQTIKIVPVQNPVQLSKPPLPPPPPNLQTTTNQRAVKRSSKTQLKTDFTNQVIFTPSVKTPQNSSTAVKPTKPAKPRPIMAKNVSKIKNKASFYSFFDFKKIKTHFSDSVIVQKIIAKKNILLSAIITGFITLLIFAFFILPHRNQAFTQSNLQTYFSLCQQDGHCFDLNRISKIYTLSFVPTAEDQVFVNDLHNHINKNLRLEKQIKSFYSVIWQKQAGDAVAEVKIINQLVDSLIQEASSLQTSFFKQKNTLSQYVSDEDLEFFNTQLSAHQQKLFALKKHLPLLEQISSIPDLNLSLILMDDRYPRSAGGLLTNIVNLKSNYGSLNNPKYHLITQISSNSVVAVATPSAVKVSNFSNKSGLHNLSFNRPFGETAALCTQIIDKSLDFKPELVIGLNLNTLIKLRALISNESYAQTHSSIYKDINFKTNQELEEVLSLQLKNIYEDLVALDYDLIIPVFSLIIEGLNQTSIQLYSTIPELTPLISQLNLDNDPNNIMCPSSLGSETCYLDAIAQNDNYLHQHSSLKQEINHIIDLTPEKTIHTRTIVYDNTLSNEAANTYLSFILPYGSTISSFQVDDKNKALDEYNGSSILIKAGQSSVVVLEFYLSRPIMKNNFTYSFYNQFQHGISDQILRIAVENNLPHSPKIIAPTAINEQKKIVFSTKENQSFHGAIAF